MAFYIKPPAGNINISQLESWALTRLQFLLDIHSCQKEMAEVRQLMEKPAFVEQSDCLIEGTTKDAVSHFILRLACAGDISTTKVFIESETTLFVYRFMNLNEMELLRYHGCLRSFQKQLSQHFESLKICTKLETAPHKSGIVDIFRFFQLLTESFDWKSLIRYYCLESFAHFVRMPFEFALEMVAKRLVVIDRGSALVPCSYLPQLLQWFFRTWLTYGMHLAKTELGRICEDSRMKRLFSKCQNIIHKRFHHFHDGYIKRGILSGLVASDVDFLVEGFPPCMAHLHHHLRKNHRLKHHSRVAYVLFLKDLGLSIDEAISFWKQEYVQPFPINHSYNGCRRSWQKEEQRYVYNIYHLYGLKGSRRNYSSHSCQYIQNHDWGPSEEGGCPFKHFDYTGLQHHLRSDSLATDAWTKICGLVEKNQHCLACSVYMKSKVKHLKESLVDNYAENVISECCHLSQVLTGSTNGVAFSSAGHQQFKTAAAMKADEDIDHGETNCIEPPLPERSETNLTENMPEGLMSHDSLYDSDLVHQTKKCRKGNNPKGFHVMGKSASLPPDRAVSKMMDNRKRKRPLSEVEKSFKKPIDFFISYNNLVTQLRRDGNVRILKFHDCVT